MHDKSELLMKMAPSTHAKLTLDAWIRIMSRWVLHDVYPTERAFGEEAWAWNRQREWSVDFLLLYLVYKVPGKYHTT